MRIVESMKELDENVESCRREALSSFKDDKILMERYVRKARHVEFQIFADSFGNVIHLFERDCSVQRRHQKVLEESPAPMLDPKLRSEMGRAAVQAAKVHFLCSSPTPFALSLSLSLPVLLCFACVVVVAILARLSDD